MELGLAADLKNAEIEVFLNRWDVPLDTDAGQIAKRIERSDALLVVGTPLYREMG